MPEAFRPQCPVAPAKRERHRRHRLGGDQGGRAAGSGDGDPVGEDLEAGCREKARPVRRHGHRRILDLRPAGPSSARRAAGAGFPAGGGPVCGNRADGAARVERGPGSGSAWGLDARGALRLQDPQTGDWYPTLAEHDRQFLARGRQLDAKDRQLDAKDQQLDEKDQQIKELKALLARYQKPRDPS